MSANLKSVATPSARGRVSREEWEVRVDLAAAYQLAAIFRWTDLIYTHFSARVPGTEHILINPYGLMFDEITASNLVKIDHTHTRAGVGVSAHKCGLLPLSQHAMRVQAQVTYHDFEGIALEMDERERLARDLGPTSKAMILRNHGLLTLGDTVREAFELMYYLDCACQIQVDALAGGMENAALMSQQAARTAAAQFERPDRPSVHKDWPALLRMLDRKGVNYRD